MIACGYLAALNGLVGIAILLTLFLLLKLTHKAGEYNPYSLVLNVAMVFTCVGVGVSIYFLIPGPGVLIGFVVFILLMLVVAKVCERYKDSLDELIEADLAITNKAPDMHPFYGAWLMINGENISLLQHQNRQQENLTISQIDYITMYRFEYMEDYDRCWLNLRSYEHAALSVCTLAGNFNVLENIVTQLTDFDVQKYFSIRNAKGEVKETLLWQKEHTSDFAITPIEVDDNNQNALDLLQQGLLIENQRSLIAWKTYEELAKHPLVEVKNKKFPNPLYKAKQYVIANPTIFNGLGLNSLYTDCDGSQDTLKLHLPVIEYTAEISLGIDRQKSLAALNVHLDDFFQQKSHEKPLDYTVKDTWRGYWQAGAVSVELYCFYREIQDSWDNIAWLKIQYKPNLDRFYINDYRRHFAITEAIKYQLFDFEIDLNANYRDVDNAIYIPDCFKTMITRARPSLIWLDTAQNTMGFASVNFALIYHRNEAEDIYLSVQNFRGSEGRNSLEMRYRGKNIHIGSVSSVAKFEKNMQEISQLIGKKIERFSYDEHY